MPNEHSNGNLPGKISYSEVSNLIYVSKNFDLNFNVKGKIFKVTCFKTLVSQVKVITKNDISVKRKLEEKTNVKVSLWPSLLKTYGGRFIRGSLIGVIHYVMVRSNLFLAAKIYLKIYMLWI